VGRGEERMAAARQLAKAAVIGHHQQYVGRTISMASWRAAAVAIVDDQAPAAERSHHRQVRSWRAIWRRTAASTYLRTPKAQT